MLIKLQMKQMIELGIKRNLASKKTINKTKVDKKSYECGIAREVP
jgi:hypothetical protein